MKEKLEYFKLYFKEIFHAFWYPKKNISKWINRLFFVFVAFIIFGLTFMDNTNEKKSLVDYQQNYSLDEGNRSFYKENYRKAKKIQKEIDEKVKSGKATNSNEDMEKNAFCSKVYMAANPDLKLQPLPQIQMDDLNKIIGKNHLKITSDEKKFFLLNPLTSGQSDYFMNNWLVPSIGVNINKVKIGYDLYSGSLFINKKDFNELTKAQQDILLKRAHEIFDSCELSVRLPKGLQISYT